MASRPSFAGSPESETSVKVTTAGLPGFTLPRTGTFLRESLRLRTHKQDSRIG